MTHICVMTSHKPIIIYMEGLILGVNTLYRLFCFFKLFPMVSKGLSILYNTKFSRNMIFADLTLTAKVMLVKLWPCACLHTCTLIEPRKIFRECYLSPMREILHHKIGAMRYYIVGLINAHTSYCGLNPFNAELESKLRRYNH